MNLPLIPDLSNPKWIIVNEILKTIGSKRAKKIASRLKIPDVQLFIDCMKILVLSDIFELDNSYVISEIKQNNKLKKFIDLYNVVEIENLYKFVSKLNNNDIDTFFRNIFKETKNIHTKRRKNVIIDTTSIPIDINTWRKRSKIGKKKKYKWAYSHSEGYYVGYKLILAIDAETYEILGFELHEGSPNGSKLLEDFIETICNSNKLRKGDFVILDRGFTSLENYRILISRFLLVPMIFARKNTNIKYYHLTYRLTYLATKTVLVALMIREISREYLSTFNRQIQTQLYNELRHDYAFPRAVCRSLSELFGTYLDLYFSSQRKEGQVIFHAVSKDVPPGVPVEEMHLVPVKLTIYESNDCTARDQQDLLDQRIIRISNEAFQQGALLTKADIAILLGESTKTITRHIAKLEETGKLIPTRGKWKDIGPGVSHKKRILELYLKGDEYTDIERKTKHTGEAIMRYVKDFARTLVLTEEGYNDNELRIITGLSDKTIREYKDLIDIYSTEDCQERLAQLRSIFQKNDRSQIHEKTTLRSCPGELNR